MNLAATLWNGLRAIVLRPRAAPVETGPDTFIALVVLYVLVTFAIAAFEVARPWSLAPDGVTTVLTDSLLTLIAAWAVMRIVQRDGIVWSVGAWLLAATILLSIVTHGPLAWVENALIAHQHPWIALLLDLVSRVWWLLVLIGVAHALAPQSLVRTLVAAILGYAISAAAWWWLPEAPLLRTGVADDLPTATNDSGTDQDEDQTTEDAAPKPEFDAEQVMYDQPGLLEDAVAKLKPQTPGVVDLYVVAFAGDGDEDVFRNEAEYAEKLFGERFHAEGRVLVLENNAATVATRPLATLTNLISALDAIAAKMDPAEDVLLVYITTHGSQDHELAVVLDPLPLDQIAPDDLADALRTKPGIRWKVVVVNACYSGGFVDALRDDSTMVITSARTDRTSFGCGADSDITYFGKAFLAEALNRTTSIPEAFEQAKTSVAAWETRDQETHSEPQIASTRSIEAKLDAWRRTVPEHAPVPFEAAEPKP